MYWRIQKCPRTSKNQPIRELRKSVRVHELTRDLFIKYTINKLKVLVLTNSFRKHEYKLMYIYELLVQLRYIGQ